MNFQESLCSSIKKQICFRFCFHFSFFFSLSLFTGDQHGAEAEGVDRDYESDNSDCDSVATFSSGQLTLFSINFVRR